MRYSMKGSPMAGRPPSTKDFPVVLLRLPEELLKRISRCKAHLELEEAALVSRTEALWRILTLGWEALEVSRQGRETPLAAPGPQEASLPTSPLNATGRRLQAPPGAAPAVAEVVEAPPPPPETPPVPTPAAQAETPALELTAEIVRIAEARTQYDRMSEREFTQHLFDRGIYRPRG